MFFSRRVHCSKFYLCSFPLQNCKEKTFAYTIYVMVQGFFYCIYVFPVYVFILTYSIPSLMLTGCVLVYRYTKERNINELRHNSMYGCENKRNSPVYRYTRTAPAYFSGHSFLTKTRLYFSFKFLGKLYCEIRRRGRLVWTVQWWDGTLVFRIDFALHYHVSEVWKANANATENTWKCFYFLRLHFQFCLSFLHLHFRWYFLALHFRVYYSHFSRSRY